MSKKKLLIYAHYYAPDVASTGQILQDLAEGMKEAFEITVICAIPSYTGRIEYGYKKSKFYKEQINDIEVIRVPVPEFRKSSKVSRIKNLIAYFFNARRVTNRLGHYDYIFAISQPPIMGGMLGVYGKKKIGAKLIYCIQDFNPEQIEAIGYIKIRLFMKMARCVDNISCKNSDLVITVGRDLVETLKKRFKGKLVPNHVMINNWINEKEIYPLEKDNPSVLQFKQRYGLDGKFIIMYSGNIGLYYDLEGLIRVIKRFKGAKTSAGHDVAFVFVGNGSVLEKLQEYKRDFNLYNVVFIPYQEKDKLIYSLNAADVHWCVNAKGIKGVSCPSKFYGIVGVGKPVLAVLEAGSEIEMLINEIGCGLVSEPGMYERIAENIAWFVNHADSEEIAEMGKRGHKYLVEHLTKDISVGKYLNVITRI